MKNSHERILNAFLDEMLNDSRPSRSAVEILRNINSELSKSNVEAAAGSPLSSDGSTDDQVVDPSHVSPIQAGPPLSSSGPPHVTGASEPGSIDYSEQANRLNANASQVDQRPAVALPNSESKQRASRFSAGNLIAVAALVLAAAFLSYLLIDQLTQPGNNIAKDDGDSVEKVTPESNQPFKKKSNRPVLPRPENDERLANDPNRQALPPENDRPNFPDEGEKQNPPRMAVRDDVPVDQNKLILPPDFTRTRNVNVAAVDANEMALEINSALHKSWESSGLKPAKPLELRNWSNRLANRLIGRTLTAVEMQQVNGFLVASKPEEQLRGELIDYMIETPKFRKEFDDYWGRTLAWELLGITQSMDAKDVDMIQTRDFIAENIAADRPLDNIAYQLLSAVGSTDKNSDKYNPASSYLVALTKRFGKRQPAVGHVAQSFMSQSLQCAQCHDGFENGQQLAGATTTQKQFQEFGSFFAQLIFEQETTKDSYYLVNRNFLPLAKVGRVEAAFKYNDLQGNEQEAFPRFQELQLGSNGFVEKVDRRSQLAGYIANSSDFSETMVDHVWVNLLNIPIDGLEGNADPNLAEMRTELAAQLASNDFKLTWLVKAIAQSDAFAVGVGTDEQLAASNPFLGASPRFNHFYHRIENRRSAIQSLAIVAGAYRSGDTKPALSAGLMARVDGQASSSKPNTILPFVPSKNSEWATSASVSAQLDLIAASKMSDEQKIRHVVLAAVGREPYQDEIDQAMAIINAAENKRTAIQDVWWSLVNSVEFRLPRTAASGIR